MEHMGIAYDIAPELNADNNPQQAWGCTTYNDEWIVPPAVCPSQRWHSGLDLGWSTNPSASQYATRAGTARYTTAFPWNPTHPGPYAVGIEDDATGNLVMYFHLAHNSVSVGHPVPPRRLD